MADYEIVGVLRPDLEEDAIEAAVARIHQRITEHGGTVKTTDRWGKRRLAYAVQKYRDGYYLLTVFALESGRVASLRQTLGLQENLLRFVVAEHHPAPARPAAPAAAGVSAAAPHATPSAATPAAPPAPASPAPAPAGGGSTGAGEDADV